MSNPVSEYRSRKIPELESAAKHLERESEAGLKGLAAYDSFSDLREWVTAIGHYKPVVTFTVAPKLSRTVESALVEGLAGIVTGLAGMPSIYYREYEFDADLHDLELVVDGKHSPAISKLLEYVSINQDRELYLGRVLAKDMARSGSLVLSHEVFRPHQTGWPTMYLCVIDLFKPNDTLKIKLPPESIQQIWVDFEPYREQLAADTTQLGPFATSIDGAFRGPFAGMSVTELMHYRGGEPNQTYPMVFGTKVGVPWIGKVLKYVTKIPDPRFMPSDYSHDPVVRRLSSRRMLTHTYVLVERGGTEVLHHWREESLEDFKGFPSR
jgi:hypothetical protein